jgi:DHA2 family methylenomycin A resistance protein-like MFS transporter
MGVAATGAVIAHLSGGPGGVMDGLRVSLPALAVLVVLTAVLSALLPSGRDATR